jgi:hypothetical protein
MAQGKPAIPQLKADPKSGRLDQRTLDQFVAAVTERFRNIEAAAGVQAQSTGGSDRELSALRSQLAALQNAVAALSQDLAAALLLAESFSNVENGFLVKQGDIVVSRRLLPGSHIEITYQDGQGGDPIISLRPPFEPGAAELAMLGESPAVLVGQNVQVPEGALALAGEAPGV